MDKINFCVVYTKTRKKVYKYFKVNRIKNKYVIDLKKLKEEEMEGESDKMFLKIVIFNKVKKAIEKGKDVYFIPDFEDEFSIEKLLNLKKLLEDNNFNILLFYDEFVSDQERLFEVLENLNKFSHSQIIKDY